MRPGGHDDYPQGYRGYFLAVPGNLNYMVKFTFGFFALADIILFFAFYGESDNQRKSFELALTSLSGYPQAIAPAQRKAKLLKKDGVYSWRSVVWMKDQGRYQPWIWHAEVARKEKDFELISSEMEPYNGERAEELSVFDDVSSPPIEEK